MSALADKFVALRRPTATPDEAGQAMRFDALVGREFDFIWRTLRRLGVPQGDVDDATQQVFLVASRKLREVGLGHERSFLFGVAMRVAADVRRSRRRRPEELTAATPEQRDPSPAADELLAARHRRALLDEVLGAMPIDLRAVFVLYELEELTGAEIAALLDLPAGTVASRLRRAREAFQTCAKRARARALGAGEGEGR